MTNTPSPRPPRIHPSIRMAAAIAIGLLAAGTTSAQDQPVRVAVSQKLGIQVLAERAAWCAPRPTFQIAATRADAFQQPDLAATLQRLGAALAARTCPTMQSLQLVGQVADQPAILWRAAAAAADGWIVRLQSSAQTGIDLDSLLAPPKPQTPQPASPNPVPAPPSGSPAPAPPPSSPSATPIACPATSIGRSLSSLGTGTLFDGDPANKVALAPGGTKTGAGNSFVNTWRLPAGGNYILVCHYANTPDLPLPLGPAAHVCQQDQKTFSCSSLP